MKEEFNLSKRRKKTTYSARYRELDVQEFIKRLKEGLMIDPDKMEEFDKLAGEELIK